MEKSPIRPLRIWAVSDGRAGNAAQALGLAEAVARVLPAEVEERHVVPGRVAAKLPARVWYGLSRLMPGWPDAGLAAGCAPPEPPWPDLAIGAGRRAAPFVAALGRQHGMKTVQLLGPQMRLSAFDLVVAPEHDGLTAPNTLATLGSVGRVTPERIREAAARLAPEVAHVPEPRVAVLVGGTGPSARWSLGDAERLAAQVAALSARHGLLVTTSRRTSPALTARLRSVCDPAQSLVYTGEGANPYPGLLGLARAVVVTEDSVNMASEAASTGLPVHVFRVAHPSPKARAFHAELTARGIARDFEGEIGHWTYVPLAEADRIARLVVERLLPGRISPA